MNSAIILICTTLVTNATSESIATKSCSPLHMPIILAAANTVKSLSVLDLNELTTPQAKPAVEVVTHNQPKHLRVAAYVPRHWHHQYRSRIRVTPTANQLSPQHKPMSFWDKLKSLPEQFSKTITIE